MLPTYQTPLCRTGKAWQSSQFIIGYGLHFITSLTSLAASVGDFANTVNERRFRRRCVDTYLQFESDGWTAIAPGTALQVRSRKRALIVLTCTFSRDRSRFPIRCREMPCSARFDIARGVRQFSRAWRSELARAGREIMVSTSTGRLSTFNLVRSRTANCDRTRCNLRLSHAAQLPHLPGGHVWLRGKRLQRLRPKVLHAEAQACEAQLGTPRTVREKAQRPPCHSRA